MDHSKKARWMEAATARDGGKFPDPGMDRLRRASPPAPRQSQAVPKSGSGGREGRDCLPGLKFPDFPLRNPASGGFYSVRDADPHPLCQLTRRRSRRTSGGREDRGAVAGALLELHPVGACTLGKGAAAGDGTFQRGADPPLRLRSLRLRPLVAARLAAAVAVQPQGRHPLRLRYRVGARGGDRRLRRTRQKEGRQAEARHPGLPPDERAAGGQRSGPGQEARRLLRALLFQQGQDDPPRVFAVRDGR